MREALGAYRGADLLNRQLYADLRLYLADDILVKVDRMSMATSLETRAPFLDGDVMELAFSMPGDFKVRGGRAQVDSQAGDAGLVSRRVLTRRKEGFSIPMKNWLRGELRRCCPAAGPEAALARGLFDPDGSRAADREHQAGARTTPTRCSRIDGVRALGRSRCCPTPADNFRQTRSAEHGRALCAVSLRIRVDLLG